jgi:hypothetical protein
MIPRYRLGAVKSLLAAGQYLVTETARRGLAELGFDEQDLLDCVGDLTVGEFYKTMRSVRYPGLWQDVYRPTWEGVPIYLKLQVVPDPPARGTAVIISFKRR